MRECSVRAKARNVAWGHRLCPHTRGAAGHSAFDSLVIVKPASTRGSPRAEISKRKRASMGLLNCARPTKPLSARSEFPVRGFWCVFTYIYIHTGTGATCGEGGGVNPGAKEKAKAHANRTHTDIS